MSEELGRILKEAKAKEQERLSADRHAKLLKVEEDHLKSLLMQTMQNMGLTNATYDGAHAEITEVTKPFISDFAALEGFIIEHGALDLLQKRLTEGAVKLRWEDGIAIPGVGSSTEQKLKIK